MRKFLLITAVMAALVAALMVTGTAFAQGTNPGTPQGPGYGRGGMMGGRGMHMANGTGILHDAMMAVYAERLGLSVEDLTTRLAQGETMAQIAASEGLTAEAFTALMLEARNTAIDQAVEDGTLTQAQADWMKQRGAGMARGGRGMRGGNASSHCPYFNQTAP